MKSLQFITHNNQRLSHAEGAEMALRGGCRWVQLRMKEATDDEFLAVGHAVGKLCRDHGARFILDDRVHLVKPLMADGVHLGKHDMPVSEARAYLNDDKLIIGGTANTFDDIKKLYLQGADYIGCGPFRFTQTKKNLAPLLGLDGYRKLIERMRHDHIDIPLIAIGGIEAPDVAAILRAGADGIAVSGAIMNADDPVEAMKQLINITTAI